MDASTDLRRRLTAAAFGLVYAVLLVWLAQHGAGPVALASFSIAIGSILWALHLFVDLSAHAPPMRTAMQR